MKKVNLLIMLFVSVIAFTSCVDQSGKKINADEKMAQETAVALNEANSQIGMPAIDNFQERKLAKMIFELRDDENLICHAYLVNRMTGEVGEYLGKCLGFGLPYSVQFTNPMKIVDTEKMGGANNKYHDSGEIQVLPQADPNGLFMPTGLSATWIMLLDDEGKPHPVYIEPEIIVSPFKLK